MFVRLSAITFLLLNLTGCAGASLIGVALIGGNLLLKDGTMIITLQGDNSATALFRQAAIEGGGAVTVSNAEYSKAEFPATQVKVELQTISAGKYRLMGSSNTSVSRGAEFKDNIGATTQNIAEYLVANGFSVIETKRDTGPITGWETREGGSTTLASAETPVSNADMVKEVQNMLNAKGYDAGPVDGIAGSRTRKALASFQIDQGLALTDGVTDEAYKQLRGRR